jgi:hypothetical protein
MTQSPARRNAIVGLDPDAPDISRQDERPAANTNQALPDFECIRKSAQSRMRSLHMLCDPYTDLVNDVNEKIGVAERLAERGECSSAYRMYQEIVRDIDQVYRNGS